MDIPRSKKHSTMMTTQTTTTPTTTTMADEPSTQIASGDGAPAATGDAATTTEQRPNLVLRLRGPDGGGGGAGGGGADPIPAAPASPASPSPAAQEHAAATRFQAVVRGRLARAALALPPGAAPPGAAPVKTVPALKRTHVVYTWDRSGSMQSMGRAPLEGLQTSLQEQKAAAVAGGTATEVSLVTFDTEIDQPLVAANLCDLPLPLENAAEMIRPRGGTRLYDAVLVAVGILDDTVGAQGSGEKGILVVMTDGQDNRSERTAGDVKAALERIQAEKNVQCLFMGANIGDAQRTIGPSMGFSEDRSMTFEVGAAEGAFRSMGKCSARAASCQAPARFSRDERARAVTDPRHDVRIERKEEDQRERRRERAMEEHERRMEEERRRHRGMCPGRCGSPLTTFDTPNDGFTCDGCDEQQGESTTMYGCRSCNFDLCHPCFVREARGEARGQVRNGHPRPYGYPGMREPYGYPPHHPMAPHITWPPHHMGALERGRDVTLDETHVGKRVSIYWPKDRKSYAGVLAKFDTESGKHTVRYDDGDTKQYDMSKRREKGHVVLEGEKEGGPPGHPRMRRPFGW